MKINDIILETRIVDEWSNTDPDIQKELEKKGYKHLGSGVDQSAYFEPKTGYVLKVFGTHPSTKGSGGAVLSRSHFMFLTWAKYCMYHKDNPYLAKFYGFEKFIFNDHTYFQIRQERLTLAGNFGYALWDLALFVRRNSDAYDQNDISGLLDGFERYERTSFKKIKKVVGDIGMANLMATVVDVYNVGIDQGLTLDLHDYNWMMRGKTPVIVDPWVA